MPDKRAPIGVFDSGVGGLTVAKEIMQQIPNERIIYFGDTARVPYGSKSKTTITKFAKQITRFLMTQKVKALVIACNTMSAYAIDEVEKDVDLPVIGVVKPGARVAVSQTRNKRIGVIATEGTIGSGMYERFITNINPDISVSWRLTTLAQLCPFTDFGESGCVSPRKNDNRQ